MGSSSSSSTPPLRTQCPGWCRCTGCPDPCSCSGRSWCRSCPGSGALCSPLLSRGRTRTSGPWCGLCVDPGKGGRGKIPRCENLVFWNISCFVVDTCKVRYLIREIKRLNEVIDGFFIYFVRRIGFFSNLMFAAWHGLMGRDLQTEWGLLKHFATRIESKTDYFLSIFGWHANELLNIVQNLRLRAGFNRTRLLRWCKNI